jgi:hypothetical protein
VGRSALPFVYQEERRLTLAAQVCARPAVTA